MVVATDPLINRSALKRKSYSLTNPNPCSVSFAPNKKLCMSPPMSRRCSAVAIYSSSSSSSDDDSETDAGYFNKQRKARKRAFSRRSTSFVDHRLSNAISKYSDVEDDDQKEEEGENIQKEFSEVFEHDLKSLSKPSEVSDVLENKLHRGSVSSTQLFFSDLKNTTKKSPEDYDKIARNRCFDYLVGAIDEAWARYCDATSYAEDEAFKNVDCLPNTPASLALSENEDEGETEFDTSNSVATRAPSISDYSSDVDLRRVSSHPSNLRLQQLKDRLLKAKYYLQDYLDTVIPEDAIDFWKRWDLVKYATIELVEDDDDDEVIESTIEELENGRIYGCY